MITASRRHTAMITLLSYNVSGINLISQWN